MADVQIQQTPSSDSGGGASWLWAIIVLILLAVIAWFVFGGGMHQTRTSTTKVEISTPGASAPAANPPSGGGTKTP